MAVDSLVEHESLTRSTLSIERANTSYQGHLWAARGPQDWSEDECDAQSNDTGSEMSLDVSSISRPFQPRIISEGSGCMQDMSRPAPGRIPPEAERAAHLEHRHFDDEQTPSDVMLPQGAPVKFFPCYYS